VSRPEGQRPRFLFHLRKTSRTHPLVWPAAAATAGAIAVGVLFLLQSLLQPGPAPETAGYEIFEGERFRLWYDEDSEAIAEREAFEAELKRQLWEVRRRLLLSEAEVPDRLDVFVHDSIAQMQTTVERRASFVRTKLLDAAIDIVVGDSPRSQLAEVLLYHGWGECFAQAVYIGLLRYVAEPDTPFLLTVKAAPERMRHSLDDLFYLEEIGRYPATIYQQLTGPTAPAGVVSFLGARNLITMPESISAVQADDFHVIEMASLIQYLAGTTGGLDQLKAVWGPGESAAVLARCSAASELLDLESDWLRAVSDAGDVTALPSYVRARLLYEGGYVEAAYALTRDWAFEPMVRPLVERAFAVRCAVSVGAFDIASVWAAGLDDTVRSEYERLVGIYDGWSRHETPELILLAPASAGESDDLLRRISETYDAMTGRIGASLTEQSVRPVFFLYPDNRQRSIGDHVRPSDPTSVGAVHLVLGGNWRFDMTESLLPRLWKWWPASPLVRVGIVSALSTSMDDLMAAGIGLACSGAWFPFSHLAATLGDVHTLRTEAGLLFAYVEERLDLEGLRRFWTARRVREMASLEGALQSFLGMTRQEIEQVLLQEFLHCPEGVNAL